MRCEVKGCVFPAAAGTRCCHWHRLLDAGHSAFEQRDTIYGAVRRDLSGLSDISAAIKRERAARQGQRGVEKLKLLPAPKETWHWGDQRRVRSGN